MPRVTPPLRAEPLVDENGRFTLRWSEYFEDSAKEINAASDASTIDEQLNQTPYLLALLTLLKRKVSQLEQSFSTHIVEAAVKQLQIDTAGYVAKPKNSNYTAKHNDWIEATSSARITLPDNPVQNHRVRLSVGDNSGVKMLSSLSNIKVRGQLTTSVLFRIAGESFDFHYFGDYWLIS
jgi:hypothetical protein